jgi:hypothetical protein
MANPDRKRMNWAGSRTVGQVSEIAVLAPIRRGCPPGERQTYEQRLRGALDNLNARHRQGIPTELNRVPEIHFGRIMIIRPEHYLLHSDLLEIEYYDPPNSVGAEDPKVPEPIDDFEEINEDMGDKPRDLKFRSWLLTLVEFDGDLKVYMKDINRFLADDFDKLFVNCEHYPGFRKWEPFWAWIRRYQMNVDLFYAPYGGLSVVKLKQLEIFKQRFDAFVAQVRSPSGPTVKSMDELFDQFLRDNQQYAINFPTPGGIFAAPGKEDA